MAEKDYIPREAAIAVIEEKQKELCPLGMYSRHAVYGSDREKFDAWQEIIDTLESIPAADVRPVARGKWVNDHNGKYSASGDNFYCSICKDPSLRAFGKPAKTNYCPNCGADMRPTSMSGANGEES